MNIDFVIVGGGVAGLCTAIRLTELGAVPWVIEGGDYPSHKVCGEFFSPECIEILNKWDIHPIEISYAQFHTPKTSFKFQFLKPAGGLSHISFDPLLVSRAEKAGAIIKSHTKVTHLDHTNKLIKLESGESIQAKNLILATGRIPNDSRIKPAMQYMGIKAHFEGFLNHDHLKMFLFKDGYVGISPIEQGKFNAACLVGMDRVKRLGSPEKIMTQLMSENLQFKEYILSGRQLFDWMSVVIPNLGIKDTSIYGSCYVVGDGAGTIPPATGNGLSMAISSGILAAEYAIRGDPLGFRKAWHNKYHNQIRWGKLLHQIMTNPLLSASFITLSKAFPHVPFKAYSLTH